MIDDNAKTIAAAGAAAAAATSAAATTFCLAEKTMFGESRI